MTRIERAISIKPSAVAGGRGPTSLWERMAMRRASCSDRSTDFTGFWRLTLETMTVTPATRLGVDLVIQEGITFGVLSEPLLRRARQNSFNRE